MRILMSVLHLYLSFIAFVTLTFLLLLQFIVLLLLFDEFIDLSFTGVLLHIRYIYILQNLLSAFNFLNCLGSWIQLINMCIITDSLFWAMVAAKS